MSSEFCDIIKCLLLLSVKELISTFDDLHFIERELHLGSHKWDNTF